MDRNAGSRPSAQSATTPNRGDGQTLRDGPSLDVLIGGHSDKSFVAIVDQDGYEVALWQQEEWADRIDVVEAVQNAMLEALTDPTGLIIRLYGVPEWDRVRERRDEPAWKEEVAEGIALFTSQSGTRLIVLPPNHPGSTADHEQSLEDA